MRPQNCATVLPTLSIYFFCLKMVPYTENGSHMIELVEFQIFIQLYFVNWLTVANFRIFAKVGNTCAQQQCTLQQHLHIGYDDIGTDAVGAGTKIEFLTDQGETIMNEY